MTRRISTRALLLGATCSLALPLAATPARADYITGDIVVSESVYQDTGEASGLTVGQPITVNGQSQGTATASGTFPLVFINGAAGSNPLALPRKAEAAHSCPVRRLVHHCSPTNC